MSTRILAIYFMLLSHLCVAAAIAVNKGAGVAMLFILGCGLLYCIAYVFANRS